MGLDLGLEAAGLDIRLVLECNPAPLATIARNRPLLPRIDRPIEQVPSAEILSKANLKRGQPFAVVGGPSCQMFSTAGLRQSLNDPRSSMFWHFVRVIKDTQPKFFVMENVRGLLSAAILHRPLNRRGPGFPPLLPEEQLGSAFGVIANALRNLGYYCVFDVLNAADYGVPQTRQRLVVIGSRDGKRVQMPLRTHDRNGANGLPKWRTLRDAFEAITELNSDHCLFSPNRARYFKMIPEGGNWRDLPDDLKIEALGRAYHSWGGRSGYFRRLSLSRPCPAVTTQPDANATALCHPTELRPLSVGEYARIQQFPDHWAFEGTIRKKYEQIGNAVPVGLSQAIGIALLTASRSHARKERLGRFETFNLDLLARLARRPKTIVNPRRMRYDDENNTIGDWYGSGHRIRNDAHSYVAHSCVEQFKALLVHNCR